MNQNLAARVGAHLLAAASPATGSLWHPERGPIGSASDVVNGDGAVTHLFPEPGDFTLFRLAHFLFNPGPHGTRSLTVPALVALSPAQLELVGELFVAMARGDAAVESWLKSRRAA